MRHLISLLVTSASVSSLAAAQPPAGQPPAGQPPAGQPPAAGAPAASQAQPPSPYKNFGQLTKDAVVRKGFLDTYQKEDKLYLAIPKDRLGKEFLMEMKIAQGIGTGGIFGGTVQLEYKCIHSLLPHRLSQYREIGNRIGYI